MSAINISVRLLILLLLILLLHRMREEATDRRIRVTKGVPVLRIDHISIKAKLLRVWQVSLIGDEE